MTGWRYACPEGHRTINRIGNSVHSDCPLAFKCKTCGKRYSTVTDLKNNAEVTP